MGFWGFGVLCGSVGFCGVLCGSVGFCRCSVGFCGFCGVLWVSVGSNGPDYYVD